MFPATYDFDNKYIDLHIHSNASDGSLTPSEVVRMAVSCNLFAIALTDHDTIDGIAEAMSEAKKINELHRLSSPTTNVPDKITVIPGIELSAEYKGGDVHILGLNLDYQNPDFLKRIENFRKGRDARNEKLIALLQENGYPITKEMVLERFGNEAVITRAHFSILLVENGYAKDKNEAFEKLLNPGCPLYVPRVKVTPERAVDIILTGNGIPVLAHPVLYKHLNDQELEELISNLKNAGLLGIEAIYCLNKENDEECMKALAKKYDLFVTGGSDFHGDAKPNLRMGTGYGNLKIPAKLLEPILVQRKDNS